MERRIFELTVDGRDIELTQDNHGIAMFRDEPEYDYMDIREEVEGSDELAHTLIYRHRELLLWMGLIATQAGDAAVIRQWEAEHGDFAGRTGWNSPVYIEDQASDFEKECFIKAMTKDLDAAEGADDLLAG